MEVTGPLGFQCQVTTIWTDLMDYYYYCHCQAPPPVSSSQLLMDTSKMKIVVNFETLFVNSAVTKSFLNHLQVKSGLYCDYYADAINYLLMLLIQKVISSLPTTQMIIHTTMTRYWLYWFWCLPVDWNDYCRLGSCSQPMTKQLPSPSTVWILILVLVLAQTGWRSMMGPPPSATAALIMVIITMLHMTTSAPPSPAPSPAPPQSRSSSAQIPSTQKVASLRLSAALHMLRPQIWLLVSKGSLPKKLFRSGKVNNRPNTPPH